MIFLKLIFIGYYCKVQENLITSGTKFSKFFNNKVVKF